jgi:hypothetical protein
MSIFDKRRWTVSYAAEEDIKSYPDTVTISIFGGMTEKEPVNNRERFIKMLKEGKI